MLAAEVWDEYRSWQGKVWLPSGVAVFQSWGALEVIVRTGTNLKYSRIAVIAYTPINLQPLPWSRSRTADTSYTLRPPIALFCSLTSLTICQEYWKRPRYLHREWVVFIHQWLRTGFTMAWSLCFHDDWSTPPSCLLSKSSYSIHCAHPWAIVTAALI